MTFRSEVHLDYETYSDLELTSVGAWCYAMHPSTEVLCAVIKINGKQFRWRYGDPPPRVFAKAIDSGALLWAWNANFERAITEEVVCKMFPRFPRPKLSQWRDSQAVAAMCRYPLRLEYCAKALGLEQKKDTRGKMLINLFSKPNKKTRKRVFPSEEPERYNEFIEYCAQDVKVEEEVLRALPINDLGSHQRVWELDSKINSRGVMIDSELCKGAVKLSREIVARASDELKKVTDGAVSTGGQTQKIKDFCESQGLVIPNVQEQTVLDILKRKDVSSKARRVLELRLTVAKSSATKYGRMLVCQCPDGRVRGSLQYHGAGTGRWAGRLFQPHNLARPRQNVMDMCETIARADYQLLLMLYDDVLGVLRDAVRHALIPGARNTFIISDLSAIEARVLGWMANEPRYLEAYRKGLDLYKATAALIFGVPYEDIDDDQRFLGKQCVLGLGYGMGAPKFNVSCENAGQSVPRTLTDKAVKVYRSRYKMIPRFWNAIERAAIQCVVEEEPVRVSCLEFQKHGNHLAMKLPSGRRIWYPEARARQEIKWGEPRLTLSYGSMFGAKWGREGTYSGKLTENADQAISADVIATALLRSEKHGMPIAIHVHDEIVSEVPKEEAAEAVHETTALMTKPIKWARGLPLGAKTFQSPRYMKD